MYFCKVCGQPIESTIEGEPICPTCRALAECTPEDLELDQEREWFATHCSDCGREWTGPGDFCPACQQEHEEVLRVIGW